MGNITKSCLFYLKDKDNLDEDQNTNNNSSNIEPIINMSDIKINEKDLSKNKKQNPIFTMQFNSNPFEKYKIILENSPYSKIISLIDNPEITHLMIIIPNKENMRNNEKNDYFLNKVNSLQLLEHTHIFKIYEIYIYDNNYYLICEYIKEKNLIEKISSGTLDESITKIIMEQILNSIIYLHEKNIFNIGLKLDEIIFFEITLKVGKIKLLKKKNDQKEVNKDNEDKKGNETKKKYDIKISTINYLKENYETTDINSLFYYSPEIIEQIEENDLIKNNDNEDVNDEWVCGIIMYYLLSGEFPFKGKKKEEIFSNIKNNNIDFSSQKFEQISISCKDLISKLLEKDKNKRIKANDCLDHSFFTGDKLIENEELDEELLEILKNLLKVKKPASKFHEVIIAYLCLHFLDEEEEKKLSDLFEYIDKDRNNVISEEDIKNAFDKNKIIYTDEDIKNILDVFDYDQNNLIQLQEFLRVLCNKKKLFKHENIESVFNTIDIDKNNYINAEDIKKFVAKDEKAKNKVEKEFMEPFGMKPDDKLLYHNFYQVIKNDILFQNLTKNKKKKK